MTEPVDANNSRLERRKLLNARRNKRYRRRNREAERHAKRHAKHLARRIESGEAPISTYDDLVAYMVARRKALGLSQLELDDRCGWRDGYISHLENWKSRHGRVAGSVSMEKWFAALGVKLRPVSADPAPAAKPGDRLNGADLSRRRRD